MVFRQTSLLALATLPFSLAQISDDFESGWDQTLWPIYAPDCNQGGTVALDTTMGHSGTNSMKVTSPGGYCGHIFFGTTEVPTGDVYVRVWLQATDALTANHVTFITMPDNAQAGDHLRIGGQDEILMYNRESDDATLPDMSPQGTATSVALPTGDWECLEYYLGSDGTIETWLNSAAIPGLNTANNSNAQGWDDETYIPEITGVYFGWESYGGDVNTFWYDDVSIQSTRVGCSVTGVSTAPATTATGNATTTTATDDFTTTTTLITSTTSSAASTTTTAAGTVPLYGQCGGEGWTGGTVCESGTCQASSPYYSQCLP